MKTMDKMLAWCEVGLIAKRRSAVDSRSKVNPFDENGKQRVFISPMTCLLNNQNFDEVNKSSFIPIYPVRYKNWAERINRIQMGDWVAMQSKEILELINDSTNAPIDHSAHYKICLDTAQGQRIDLYELTSKFKDSFPNSEIMIGNIMNPEAYIDCAKAGADYVRCAVGTGNGCITSVNTGFHASLPWILNGIQQIKDNVILTDDGYEYYERDGIITIDGDEFVEEGSMVKFRTLPKVIADGGMDESSKIIKAYALGADYVMIGRLFAETTAACGELVGTHFIQEREYYGQASEQGQIDRFGEIHSKPEGIKRTVKVKCTLDELCNGLEKDLRSAMSYGGAFTMDEFIGQVEWREQTRAEYESYNK